MCQVHARWKGCRRTACLCLHAPSSSGVPCWTSGRNLALLVNLEVWANITNEIFTINLQKVFRFLVYPLAARYGVISHLIPSQDRDGFPRRHVCTSIVMEIKCRIRRFCGEASVFHILGNSALHPFVYRRFRQSGETYRGVGRCSGILCTVTHAN